MNKVREFFSETYQELMYKVSWPSWEDLQGSTIVVTVATLIFAAIVYIMNEAGDLTMNTYYHLFK